MSNKNLTSILHISDFHYTNRDIREQEIVVEALLQDLADICIGHRRPDVILFSGDLVKAAGSDSHFEAYDVFISKVADVTKCSDERIFLVPGNHDASRAVIESSLDFHRECKAKADDMAYINNLYHAGNIDTHLASKFEGFFELQDYLTGDLKIGGNQFFSVFRIDVLNIDIVLLNSAVFTSGGISSLNNDQGNIIIPEYAVRDALKKLTPNSFRIFATHHPLSWFSNSGEKYLRTAIFDNADMHLFGHKHDPVTAKINSFSGDLYSNQAGAIFSGRNNYIGYSLITVDLSTKFFETHLRSFFKDRSRFDEARDVVAEGKCYSSPEAKKFFQDLRLPVDDKIIRTYLSNDYLPIILKESEEFSIGGRYIHDIFVPPPMVRVHIYANDSDETSSTIETTIDFEELIKGNDNFILSASPEFGRTTVLRELQIKMLSDLDNIKFPRLPIICDFDDIKSNYDSLFRVLRGRCQENPSKFELSTLLDLGYVCIMIDDVVFEDSKRMKILREFVSRYPKARYIFSSLKSPMVTYVTQIDPEMPIRFDKVEVLPFRRKDMRQFVSKMNGDHNVEEQLDRLQAEIRGINLPFTAANGSILMVIFEEHSGFRPTNRSMLVEQFIDVTLHKASADQSQRITFDYSNKTALLAYVAAWMVREDEYVVDKEAARVAMKAYLDKFGLNADLSALLEEFFGARIFVRRPDNRLSFRYRAVLEYFIAQHMVDNEDFKNWIIQEERYLSFINEIQYFSGKLRNDEKLISEIESRFVSLLSEIEKDESGVIELDRIANLKLPHKNSDKASSSYFADQLSRQPLTEAEKDEELEADLPKDVENRQEVFRPQLNDLGQRFLISLFLYSGVLKNMERIEDTNKRHHLEIIWKGWAIFLLKSLQRVDDIARLRKFRMNGVLYEISAPRSISNEELARIIALSLPTGFAQLILRTLGTEKLERQLTEPNFDSCSDPLVFEFFRAALIADLRLPAAISALKAALARFKLSPYLSEAMVCKIAELRRYDRLSTEQFSSLSVPIAETIARLKGGDNKKLANEKRSQLARLKQQDVILRLRKASDRD